MRSWMAAPMHRTGSESCRVRPRTPHIPRPPLAPVTETKLDIHRFWGKAQPLQPECGPGWHPLIFHSLDVAAVGEALLAKHRRMGDHLARLLGLGAGGDRSPGDLAPLPARRRKAREEVPGEGSGPLPALLRRRSGTAFGVSTITVRADCACSMPTDGFFKLPSGTATPHVAPSGVRSHRTSRSTPGHGEEGRASSTLKDDFGAAGIEAARLFVRKAHDLFGIPRDMPPLCRERVRAASFALAGLAVLADWIGSNQKWFPYRGPDDFQDLDSYWNHARARSERAIEESGVLPAAPRVHLDQGALIGERAVPTPMQEWACTVELPTGPTLFMIEDETGSGKTEAALILAHRLMASGRADGLYMALPTMATANAMFDRLGVAHRKLFAEGAEPSVALAHGARDMHEGFRSAVLRAGRGEAPYSGSGERDGGSEMTASTACAHWIADDRRRAFLADAGAGTVDQALLSILPSRHQSLRLLGLMRRVLILDEVHAYDAYVQREIERLLEFQAGLGGCAILLSATLPLSIRAPLADAFARGLGEQEDADRAAGGGMAYPMATVRAAGVQFASGVPGRPGHGRTLPVRFLRTPDEALAEVEQAACAGKAVLYIRNTVDDALCAHAALAARGLDPDLFHARFALEDRLEIEGRVVKAFGKHGTPAERAGKVLIATQVVEQSLDLDFDALITDLAPIDLLIQRAGRLWRHERREREGRPELAGRGAGARGRRERGLVQQRLSACGIRLSGSCPSLADRQDARGHGRHRKPRWSQVPCRSGVRRRRGKRSSGRAGRELLRCRGQGGGGAQRRNHERTRIRQGVRAGRRGLGCRCTHTDPARRRSTGDPAARTCTWWPHRAIRPGRRAGRALAGMAVERGGRQRPEGRRGSGGRRSRPKPCGRRKRPGPGTTRTRYWWCSGRPLPPMRPCPVRRPPERLPRRKSSSATIRAKAWLSMPDA